MKNVKWKMENRFRAGLLLIVQPRASVPTHATPERLSRNLLLCCKNCARHRLVKARARSKGNQSARDSKPRRSSFPQARQSALAVTQQKFWCCKASAG